MDTLTVTLDERDQGRLHLQGDAIGADLPAVLDAAVTLLAPSGSQVVVEVGSVSAADSRLVVLLNDLARHAARLRKRVILEISDDAPDWLAQASFDQAIRIERTRLVQVAAKSPRAVLSAVDGAPAGRARRQGRGFVVSYGEGRRCAASGCRTYLSRYNSDESCWLHESNRGSRRG